jgi:hypothetical protein
MLSEAAAVHHVTMALAAAWVVLAVAAAAQAQAAHQGQLGTLQDQASVVKEILQVTERHLILVPQQLVVVVVVLVVLVQLQPVT